MNSMLNETPGLFTENRSNSVELHAADAARIGLEDGQWARVSSRTGSIELPVALVDGGREGVVTIAHGWGSRIFDPRGGAEPLVFGANRNLLVDREHIDPLSQMPSLNATPVRIEVLKPSDRRAVGHEPTVKEI